MQKVERIANLALLAVSIISYVILSRVPTPEANGTSPNIMGHVMFTSYWAIPTALIIIKLKNIKLKISYNFVLYCLYTMVVASLVASIWQPSSHWSTVALALILVIMSTREKILESLYKSVSLILLTFLLWEAVYLTTQYWQMFMHITYRGTMGYVLLISFVAVGIWFNISYLHLLKERWTAYLPVIIPIGVLYLGMTIYWASNWMPYTWDTSSLSWSITPFNYGVWIVHKASKVVLLSGIFWLKQTPQELPEQRLVMEGYNG